MNCTLCHLPVVLHPTAAQRAASDVTGRTAREYTLLFPRHAECELKKRAADTAELKKREQDTAELMRRLTGKEAP